MRERVCSNCGGKRYVEVAQNTYKCLFCGTIYVDEKGATEEDVLLVGANEKLRALQFGEAEKEFDKIISLYPKSYEAFFGRVLSKNKANIVDGRTLAFFGDEIHSYFGDEDFEKATSLAPREIKENYEALAKFADVVRKNLKNTTFDVILNGNFRSPHFKKMKEALNEHSLFTREDAKKNNANLEAQVFEATKSAKCEVLLLERESDLDDAKIKNLFQRFVYRITNKQRFPSSFIVAYDDKVVDIESIKGAFPFLQVLLSVNEISFLYDLKNYVKKAVEKEFNQTVTLEKREVERVSPTLTNPTVIEPKELGTYKIENATLSDQNKTKWIFYSLKNGDFQTAEKLIAEQTTKTGEIAFASLLLAENLRTPEEFFSSLDNFKNKELLEDILKYSSKEFAEKFINRWEELVVNENDADTYIKYLPFLMPYENSYRETFLKSAENLALDTQNKALVECVEKAISNGDELVNFYFQLAQKTGDEGYYQKVLLLNSGHAPSLFALFMKNFSSPQEKLSFRDDEKVKNVLKFCTSSQKDAFLTSLISQILDVAFFDLKSAEKQFDYYLSYFDHPQEALKKIGSTLKSCGFFTLAEKYITLAIGNAKTDASLYFELLEIKAHARSEAELLTTSVKLAEMDDFKNVLSYASERDAEHYAQIVANANINSAQKVFRAEVLDKISLKEKLKEFILRNDKILNEVDDEATARYYRAEIFAFENYFEKIDDATNFEVYMEIVDRVNARLEALNLTLDSSISLADIAVKSERYGRVLREEKSRAERYLTDEERASRKKKRDIILFLTLLILPTVLCSLLFVFVLIFPKSMYMSISQEAVIAVALFSLALGIGAFVFNLFKKNTKEFYRVSRLCIFAVSIVNLFLMLIGLYVAPPSLEVINAKEFTKLVHNAKYANILVMDDLDFEGETFKPQNFYGTVKGGDHKIYNFSASALFSSLSGEVVNLNIEFVETEEFYGLTKTLSGKLENCNVRATFSATSDGAYGGLAGTVDGGEITSCTTNLSLNISGEIVFGGLVGNFEDGKITKSRANINGDISGNGIYGGLVGYAGSGEISESYAEVDLSLVADNAIFGGLVGRNRGNISNSYSQGMVQVEGENNLLGGIAGEFFRRNKVIEKSYSNLSFSLNDFGGIVGAFKEGKIENSFAFTGEKIYLTKGTERLAPEPENTTILSVEEFENSFNLSEDIWEIENGKAPKLKAFSN